MNSKTFTSLFIEKIRNQKTREDQMSVVVAVLAYLTWVVLFEMKGKEYSAEHFLETFAWI